MTDERELIKKRASFKGRLTAFNNYLSELKDTLSSSQVSELQLRVSKIELLYEQYDEVQLKLECIVDDINSQINERNDFESTYYKILSKAHELIRQNKNNLECLGSEKDFSRINNNKLVKLPTIQLPKFSGSYDNWLEFHDTFSSLIHSNDDIDDINKFHYLRASLEGTAAVVIQSIEFSASNYSVAWNLLCGRFNNKRILIQNHVTALFNIEVITKESSFILKRMIDSVSKNLRALESLGEPINHWNTLLIHIITHKLDSKTYREWEEYKGHLDNNKIISFASFLSFIQNRADLLETLELSRNPQINQNKNKIKSMVSVTKTQNRLNEKSEMSQFKLCPNCKAEHSLNNCSKFLGLSSEQRLELLPQFKVCYNCLRFGHFANRCKSSGCKVCKRKHNTLIHVSDMKLKTTPNLSSRPEDGPLSLPDTSCEDEHIGNNNITLSAQVSTYLRNKNQVLLATSLIKIYGHNNKEYLARAILDSGSTSCLITERLSKLLELPIVNVNESLLGINNSKSHIGKMCCVPIKSLNENFNTNLFCFVLPHITDEVPSQEIPLNDINIPSNLCLADPRFHTPSSVDLIIGADVFWDLLGVRKISLGNGKPVLIESRLGWLVSGPLINNGQVPYSISNTKSFLVKLNLRENVSSHNDNNDDIQNLLTRFWHLEEVCHDTSVLSAEEKMCEEHFIKNTTRLQDGRFCVRIPLKQSRDILGGSLQRAKLCLLSLERRFKDQPKFKNNYTQFMSEYLTLGHMSECSFDPRRLAYFIPHHGVIRESSLTTKLRVVFNASSPTTSGISYNNLQLVGPTVQDDLLSILLRFRQHKYVLSADVEKMYRQIVVHPDDRPLQQIVWRNDPSEPMKAYQLNTVTYGTASAPYLATRCLKQIGMDCKDDKISEIIIHDFYVDDLLTGGDSIQDALDIRNKVPSELATAGMNLRKWKSNEPRVILNNNNSSLDLNIGSTEPCKTLGLSWQIESDELYFSTSEIVLNNFTKRGLLSVISQIFDPLGLLTPCIISMKILMQKLWLLKLTWDEQLPSEIIKLWLSIVENLSFLNNLRIPRSVICNQYINVDLHIFSDASQVAYGACLYVRSSNNKNNVMVRLLSAKSRVAPIRPTTIPRLELCAALVGVRLYEKVISSLRIQVRSVIFWSDSTIVLGWLKMLPNKLQPFVRNRVAEILEKTGSFTWRHVPTDLNPADYVSRGTNINQIHNLELWWSGPQFLKGDMSSWPANPIVSDKLPETRSEISLVVTNQKKPLIDFERFSNFIRLQRSMAYVLRFINICKKKPVQSKFLSNDELHNSLNTLIRLSQIESFEEYMTLYNNKKLPSKCTILKFNPFLDENKIMRIGGRLGNALFTYEKKHPIMLQSTNRFTKLLFKYMHVKLLHAGPRLLLASIREMYWPIGGLKLAKYCYRQCYLCCRYKGRVINPLMGNLPQGRVTPGGFPFESVGVDYAGPIMSASRQGRGCKLTKVYILIFVCFATKAVHVELTGDLTSNNYLSALRRFISRRGKPKHIYSDNGTSFVGAYNEIGRFIKDNCISLSENLAQENINFHFIPPQAPHFGGLWEAGVKSIKYHLRRVLGNCNLTYEGLNTVLVQIEGVLNSRPLTPLSTDPDDLLPLTPGHFLIGRPITSLPSQNYEEVPSSRLSRYQRIQQLRQHFWRRWSKEYLSELQQRSKWRSNADTLGTGDLVVLKEDNLPPLKWRLGRITAFHPGADGINRVADIRTATGIVRRPFCKICPLPNNKEC